MSATARRPEVVRIDDERDVLRVYVTGGYAANDGLVTVRLGRGQWACLTCNVVACAHVEAARRHIEGRDVILPPAP